MKIDRKSNLVGAVMLPTSTLGNLSNVDEGALVVDDISSLEQSVPRDGDLDELMPCCEQQPGVPESVGPELDEGTIDDSSPVLGGQVSEVQDGFDSGGGSFACGAENGSGSSLSSNWLSTPRGRRNHFPALTSMQRKYSANELTNNVQASSKGQKIIIIKPIGDCSKTIFSNPIKFTQALMETPFNSSEINEIRTNKQSRTIVAELCRPNQKLMDELLSVSQTGEWTVKCPVPVRDRFK